MPTVKISKKLQSRMTKKEFEEYLIGSGKPEGLAVTISDEEITWVEAGQEATVEVIMEPEPEPEPTMDYGKMTKLEIEVYVREPHGIERDRRHTKGDLVAQAMELDAEGAD